MNSIKKYSKYIYGVFLVASLVLYIMAVTRINILSPTVIIGGYLILVLATVVTFIVSTFSEIKSIKGSKMPFIISIVKNTALIFVVNYGLSFIFKGVNQSLLYTFVFSLVCGISFAVYVDRKK